MKKWIRVGFPAILTIILFSIPVPAALAGDVDFSCMSYKVWGKSHVSDRFREYDIVLQNRCPGDLYWSMCIERMDPWTNEVLETHTPTGYVEEDKKARVNLQLKRNKRQSQFRNRFQEFYVNFAYEIETPAKAACFARQCETKKRDLRAKLRANEAAWERADKSLAARVASECPDTGWDTESSEECEATLREAGRAEMEQFSRTDQELREKMNAIDPEHCQVWSGELTGD
jgi:hypothetical protein